MGFPRQVLWVHTKDRLAADNDEIVFVGDGSRGPDDVLRFIAPPAATPLQPPVVSPKCLEPIAR